MTYVLPFPPQLTSTVRFTWYWVRLPSDLSWWLLRRFSCVISNIDQSQPCISVLPHTKCSLCLATPPPYPNSCPGGSLQYTQFINKNPGWWETAGWGRGVLYLLGSSANLTVTRIYVQYLASSTWPDNTLGETRTPPACKVHSVKWIRRGGGTACFLTDRESKFKLQVQTAG